MSVISSPEATARQVLAALQQRYPHPRTHLDAQNAWELLVATVLAAQCTDARVNTVTPELFRRWPTPAALAGAPIEELEGVIRPTGFYHSKAKNLLGAARRVCEVFDGQIPQNIEDLITIPGVARKTANVVLFGAFGINEGLAVDTHVKRIAYRLGLTDETDPVPIERDLMKLFPREEWGDVNHRMVWFGREVCDPASPCATPAKCGPSAPAANRPRQLSPQAAANRFLSQTLKRIHIQPIHQSSSSRNWNLDLGGKPRLPQHRMERHVAKQLAGR